MKQMRCKSGLMGWVERLRSGYGNFYEFKSYCEMYGIHTRLGYGSPENCWRRNPTINGSVEPSDLRVVRNKKAKK